MIAELDYQDFEIGYDVPHRLPVLIYRGGNSRDVKLMLTLPLLDYIHARSTGNLNHGLIPIHLAQLEWFRSELLLVSKTKHRNTSNFIGVLRAGIDGEVKLYRYLFDENNQRLEKD